MKRTTIACPPQHGQRASGEFDSYPLHMTGSVSGGSAHDDDDDVVAQLHAVVKEVTGRDVVKPPKSRMGFLP